MKEITYKVEIGFAGYIDTLEEIEIDAPVGSDENDLEGIIQDDSNIYLDLLTIDEDDIVELGDDGYEITVNFAGYVGADETYTVYAESIDDAIEEAYEAAKSDLTIESFEPLDYEEDDVEEDYDNYDQHSEEWYIARDHGEDTDPFM